MDDLGHGQVVEANVQLHTHLAARYRDFEPHYRPENIEKVDRKLAELAAQTQAKRLLDLGCGTGFMIDIAKHHVGRIDGVDVTPAMLGQVDQTGPAEIHLHQADTASFEPEPGAYDLVTAYSFLHHLFDPQPTLRVATKALRPGGIFYADLDPNHAFWSALQALDPNGSHGPVVERELRQLHYEDQAMQKEYGVSQQVFDQAEYGKNIAGGFRGEDLVDMCVAAGFASAQIHYHWFLGEAAVLHGGLDGLPSGRHAAETVAGALHRAMPLSRHLFKYLGVVAVR